MQFLAAFIMKGRMQAMLVASSLAFLSLLFLPVSIVSSATVALVTLRLGGKEGLYVLLSSCLAAALLSMLLLGDYQFALIRMALWMWVPVWVIAIVLREGRRLEVAVEIAVLLGVAGVIGFYLYEAEPVAYWRSLLSMIIPLMMQAQSDLPEEAITQLVETFALVMTGGFAAVSVYLLLFGLFLARWWQAKLYNPGGFRTEFLGLKGKPHLAIATLLTIALAWLASGVVAQLSVNLLVVLFVFYTFIGTAVLHCVFANLKNSRFMVPFLYITLLSIPHVMLLVAFCGLGDTWLDLRNKLKPKGV